MEVAVEYSAEAHIQCDLVQVEANPGNELGWAEGMPEKDEEEDETGESLDKPVFAYRGDGKDPCVEFKSGHAKFLSALNAHLLPDLGSSHRAQQAAEAYKEFLHGLQLIGAQETINQHGVHSKNILELYNWERQIQGAVRVVRAQSGRLETNQPGPDFADFDMTVNGISRHAQCFQLEIQVDVSWMR